ncbi:MAG: PAS domain-containing protein [Ignavibacteria bacterium]|nr:PAS domain-containing protein [Ignavibacteria bacterium]MCC7159547.1 PAS domain-containing protein [Ignavibacteria bacterium]
MRQRKFLWKIYYVLAAFSIIPLIVLGFYASSMFNDSLITNDSEILKVRTRLIKDKLESIPVDSADLNTLALKLDSLSSSRITFILPNGKVAADSREDASHMDNHADRPEVIEAINKGIGISQRFSFTIKEDYLYSAMPVYDNQKNLKLIVRSGYPLSGVRKEARNANIAIVLSIVLLSGIILVVGYISLKSILNPISLIKSGAERFAGGEFDKKIFPPENDELKSIANSLNIMARQLDEKLDIIGEQSNLQKAVLESMKEGVLAVDYDERILLINKTAEDILGITDKSAHGKTLQEVIRISEIQKFFKKIISEGNPHESEIILQHEKEKYLQLSGTLLYDIDNNALGSLVVFNDISNLKHLDTIKKDLVANVSHELKTPVTTIKGFIETLREGAIKDTKNAERFLEIIAKHIDRLNLIIDDLLILAKLEDKPDEIEYENENILKVLKSVIEDFEFKTSEKKISIEVKCDDKLEGRINKNLMEQAIGNLIDNAIKYSDKKSEIEIGAYEKDRTLVIYVKDSGYGISEEHMPRLFERFYRIDKGRSREEGGTGLGLAIVKHIVNGMNGIIEVDSKPGSGSTFTIKIPQEN